MQVSFPGTFISEAGLYSVLFYQWRRTLLSGMQGSFTGDTGLFSAYRERRHVVVVVRPREHHHMVASQLPARDVPRGETAPLPALNAGAPLAFDAGHGEGGDFGGGDFGALGIALGVRGLGLRGRFRVRPLAAAADASC
jgi:hypothetical protein